MLAVVATDHPTTFARKEINPDAQIQPTFSGAQICDIAGPDLIPGEILCQGVRRNKLTMIAIGRFLCICAPLSVDAMLVIKVLQDLAAF
ncbi:MAG: hypothetical protein IPP97_25140 [Candidatus Obscuribacter sp.]|nr:hypothetical protein [Candidatus Obscuribacter sp.]